MTREEWFNPKFAWLKKSTNAFGVGLVAIAIEKIFSVDGILEVILIGIFALTLLPFIFWLVMIPVLHWKDRYVGTRSTAWGAVLVIETSGWSKLVYWFRHVLPDYNKSWRYRELD